jgi:pfkB family carbohydrate kinase
VRVSLPPVTPVDATGAGDCFNAGLIAGLIAGLALPEAAALGCAAGALSTRAPDGTASSPDMPAATRLAKLASVTSAALRTAIERDQGTHHSRSGQRSLCRTALVSRLCPGGQPGPAGARSLRVFLSNKLAVAS